jgi:hypothetical protein
MTFANFITIQYKLVLEKVPVVDTVTGGSIFGFAILFVALYFPIAILIGYWHRKSQWKVEAEALFKENKIGATMWLFVIDLIDGKITEKEKQEMREMLQKITKGKNWKASRNEDQNSESNIS